MRYCQQQALSRGTGGVSGSGAEQERDSAGNLTGTPRTGVDKDQRYTLTVEAQRGSRTTVALDRLTEVTSARVTFRDPRAKGVVIESDQQAGFSVSVPVVLNPALSCRRRVRSCRNAEECP